MNPELAMAKCRFEELKLQARELQMEAEEARRDLREATAPFVLNEDLDTARVIFHSARLVKAIENLRGHQAEMLRLRKEYNL
ncbi:MAG: hypothetical protein AB9866_10985 [Syntrophobacteraceae bacterium]